jgi:hypothetical protein
MNASLMLPVRRVIAICMVAVGALSLFPVTSFAQACGGRGGPPPISSGTKFLLVFMSNEAPGYDQSTNRYQDIYLASNDPDKEITVTITCRAFTGWSKVITLAPHGSASYRLSTDPVIGYPNHDALIEIPEVVDSTVFKVVATAPITCYGMSNKEFTADAFLALPYDPLSTEYRIMSYYNSNQPGLDPMPSEFAIASFDNNNTITITPAAVTSSGSPKGMPMVFVLDSDECVQIEGDKNELLGDMTGSIVQSTKPVAVYGGHVRTETPTGFNYNSGGQHTSRDHLCEAMPPVSTWGKTFIAKNFGRANGDIMRVLAYKPTPTTVRINGKVWRTLNANQFADTSIDESAIATENIDVVESDQPILVGMIAHTADPTSQVGDPFLAIVPPLEQGYNDFTYFISTDNINYIPTEHYLIIATEEHGAGNIIIDSGLPLPSAAYTHLTNPIGNYHYAITTVKQTPGIHHIFWTNAPAGPGNGFSILAYGWGNVISYGYTAGQLLVPHTGIIQLHPPPIGAAPSPGDPVPTVPSITVRNILTEKIYFDSAKVYYTQNNQNIAVRLKKNIVTETRTIVMAEEKELELATSQPVKDVVAGKIRIWYHTALWTDLEPVDFPFVITPQAPAGVDASNQRSVVLENYPNPAVRSTTVHFAIPTRAHASVKMYDALGRMVKVISQGIVNSDDQEIQVSTRGLTPGEYTLELVVPELGINEHRKMIVIE